MASNYQPNIPTGTVNLDVDYQNLQQNFQQLDTSFGVDHKLFSDKSNLNGYHTVLHLVSNSVNSGADNNYPPLAPIAVVGTSEIFGARSNDGISTDTNLSFQSGNNKVVLLTRNFVPFPLPTVTNKRNGYTFLPGGMILQWGFIAASSTFSNDDTGSVLFVTDNINFTYTCFNVQICLIVKGGIVSGSGGTLAPENGTVATAGFSWRYRGSSSQYTGFFWTAIGN